MTLIALELSALTLFAFKPWQYAGIVMEKRESWLSAAGACASSGNGGGETSRALGTATRPRPGPVPPIPWPSLPAISIAAVHAKAMPHLADMEFRVSRPAATTTALTVSLSVAQTASYLSNTSPIIIIPANQTSASEYEGHKQFRLQLSRWSGNAVYERTRTGENLSGTFCLTSARPPGSTVSSAPSLFAAPSWFRRWRTSAAARLAVSRPTSIRIPSFNPSPGGQRSCDALLNQLPCRHADGSAL